LRRFLFISSRAELIEA